MHSECSIRGYPEAFLSTSLNRDRDAAAEARELVRRYYDCPGRCGTATIASELGLSASALCHRYRLAFDSTIGADVRRLRIARACDLLRDDPSRLLKEVAAEVGYVHAAYRTFMNAFRAETGVAPTTYVRALREGRLHPLQPRRVEADDDTRQSRICSA